jgi:outer membrane scaffolding protein for murein synthesis (MipA/OmpV family)
MNRFGFGYRIPRSFSARSVFGGLLFFGCLTVPAAAADLTPPAPNAKEDGWIVTLGAGPQILPTFPAAKTYRVLARPNFAWRRPDEPEPFYTPDDGLGVALFETNWLKAGPVGRFVPRRDPGLGNGNFVGLHNVEWTFEAGAFAELWPSEHLRTRFELRQGINGHQGLDANVEIDLIQKLAGFTFSLGPRLALGNGRFTNAYFSVTPAEAATNGRVYPYRAYGGMTSFGALATIKYRFSPAWDLMVFGGYNRFVNSASESPIPNLLGSKDQFLAGASLSYSFHFGGF